MADLVASYGLILDEWQENVLEAGLGERSDGRWAARQIGLSTPRQNGKTQLIVARALAGLLLFGEETIIVSAHRQDTARETFLRLVQIIEENPSLEDRVDFIARSEMREFIRMTSGQTVRFKARSAGAGRGFSCDCLLLDEAQSLDAAAWSAILPTMSARPNPQVWLFGTPPTKDDDGEVFTRLRAVGLAAKEPRFAYLEWGAEPDDPIEEPTTWAKANPAYGTRIEYEAIEAELASMSPDQFQLERLGIWNEQSGNAPVIAAAQWRDMLAAGPPDGVRPVGFGVDMSHARDISVSACWVEGDSAHVEEVWADRDAAAAADWIAENVPPRVKVAIDPFSSAPLISELKARGVPLHRMHEQGMDTAAACGAFESRAKAGTLTHAGQPRLTDALAGARRRPIRGTGGWGWDRRDPTSQIHPIVSATLALFGASQKRRPRSENRRTRRGREAVVL